MEIPDGGKVGARRRPWVERAFQGAAERLLGFAGKCRWGSLAEAPSLSGHRISLVLLSPNRTGEETVRDYSGCAVGEFRARLPVMALMEALESLALDDSRSTARSRHGVAAHFTEAEARRGAYGELVERDALLFHWLTERPARAVTTTAGTRVVELESADSTWRVCLAASRDASWGCWHLGLGAAGTVDEASAKALREWSMGLHAHEVAGGCPAPTDPAAAELARHHRLSADREVSALVDWILTGPPLERAKTALASLQDASFLPLPTRNRRYRVVQASHGVLFPLHFGADFARASAAWVGLERIRRARPAAPHFHPRDGLLPHPFD